MSTAVNTTPAIVITVTETIVTTYRVSAEQLQKLNLPNDVAALEHEDSDEVATSLEESLDPDGLAVTERDITFTHVQQ